MDIEFQSLQKSDIGLVFLWSQKPHLQEFYTEKISTLWDAEKKYFPRIEWKVPSFSYIALYQEVPFWKIQCYKNVDFPEYAQEIWVSEWVSIDLHIGDENFLGKGFGKAMLSQFLEKIVWKTFPQEKNCYICHDIRNTVAIKNSLSCGFKECRKIVENGIESTLLVKKNE